MIRHLDEEQIAYYGGDADLIDAAEQRMLLSIGKLLEQLADETSTNLEEHVRSRIKSVKSAEAKLAGRNLPPGGRSAVTRLSDVIGIRIVTHFVGDVYILLKAIESCEDWKVVEVKDYISAPKDNGYRSLHVIVSVPTGDAEVEEIRGEIQLRTIAMDCWAALEHEMKYKKNIQNAELITGELKRCADEIASTDLTLQTLREMIRAKE